MTQNIGVLGGNCSLHFRVKDFFTPLFLRLLAHYDFWVCLGPSGAEGGPEKGWAWPSRISDVIEGTGGCQQLILAVYWTECGIGQQKREGKGVRKGGGNKEAEGKGEVDGSLSGWKVEAVPTARAVVVNDLVLCWFVSPGLCVSWISQKDSLLWLFLMAPAWSLLPALSMFPKMLQKRQRKWYEKTCDGELSESFLARVLQS